MSDHYLYDVDEYAESLGFESIAEAVEEWAGELYIDGHDVPETVVVHRFSKPKIDAEREAKWILESLLDQLSERYRYEDTEEATPEMLDAARRFVGVVLDNFTVDLYQPTGSETVRVADYWTPAALAGRREEG